MHKETRTYRGHEYQIFETDGNFQTWWHWSAADGATSLDAEGSQGFNGKNTKQAAIASAQTHINAMIAKGAYN